MLLFIIATTIIMVQRLPFNNSSSIVIITMIIGLITRTYDLQARVFQSVPRPPAEESELPECQLDHERPNHCLDEAEDSPDVADAADVAEEADLHQPPLQPPASRHRESFCTHF